MRSFDTLLQYGRDFGHLFFPDLCICCAGSPSLGKSPFCLYCAADLPFTNYHRLPENPFIRHFYGRIPVEFGSALFHFRPGGKVKRMMHSLKYENRPDIGELLGRWQGNELKGHKTLRELSLVAPVPLHPARQRKRGYNQSAHFAKGLADSMEIACDPGLLRRRRNTPTQTGLNRLKRFDNMKAAFVLSRKKQIAHRHVLLVDDVLTTGATLEACARVLLRQEGVKVSMLTIAIGV